MGGLIMIKVDKPCEICGNKKAIACMNDKDNNLRFVCEGHLKELWEKLGKP